MSAVSGTNRLSPAERAEVLDLAVSAWRARGYVVKSQAAHTAVLEQIEGRDRLGAVLLTIFTLGIWLLARDRKKTGALITSVKLTVDPFGNVIEGSRSVVRKG